KAPGAFQKNLPLKDSAGECDWEKKRAVVQPEAGWRPAPPLLWYGFAGGEAGGGATRGRVETSSTPTLVRLRRRRRRRWYNPSRAETSSTPTMVRLPRPSRRAGVRRGFSLVGP